MSGPKPERRPSGHRPGAGRTDWLMMVGDDRWAARKSRVGPVRTVAAYGNQRPDVTRLDGSALTEAGSRIIVLHELGQQGVTCYGIPALGVE